MKIRIFIFLLSLGIVGSSYAQTTNYTVYALYVVNMAKYSSWPSLEGELNIVVFGKSKTYDELMKQNGKSVNGHVLKIRQAEEITDLGHAHIVYLSDGKSASLSNILKETEGKPVMIITEREGLFKKGAGFSFIILENSTLRYDMNNSELEKRMIKVSKNLTSLANSMM
jgi:hypothetical protein